MKLTSLIITASTLLLPVVASASVYTVAATDNIYGAGLSTPPAPGGNGAGTLPLAIGVTGSAYQFQYLSGMVSPDSTKYSVDANGVIGQNTDITYSGGLSSSISDNGFSLVGVFLGAGGQPITAPSALDFSTGALGVNFTSLTPQIGQVFFIGDGTNSSHVTQTFYVPTGATELYLGFADGENFVAPVGQYNDNIGSLNISVNAVPEPAPMALLVAGSALMAVLRFRNKR